MTATASFWVIALMSVPAQGPTSSNTVKGLGGGLESVAGLALGEAHADDAGARLRGQALACEKRCDEKEQEHNG